MLSREVTDNKAIRGTADKYPVAIDASKLRHNVLIRGVMLRFAEVEPHKERDKEFS